MAICSIKLMKTRLFNVFTKRFYNDIFVNRLQYENSVVRATSLRISLMQTSYDKNNDEYKLKFYFLMKSTALISAV